MPKNLINSFLFVGIGNFAIASTLAIVTFCKVQCQVCFFQSVKELAHDLEMFLPGVTVYNRVVNIGFASLKVEQTGVDHPLKGGGRVFHSKRHHLVLEQRWGNRNR